MPALAQEPEAAPGPARPVGEAPAWPSFRGPAGNGVAAAPHPVTWADDKHVVWRAAVPGGGWSSPVVAGDRVFITTAIQAGRAGGGRPLGFATGVRAPETRGSGAPKPTAEITFQVRAYALADGALVWARDVATRVPPHGVHPSNTYATESPATDGERLVVYFGAIGLVAGLDLAGEVRWTREVGTYTTTADFGTGSSVALAEGKAFVQCDNEEASFLAAFCADDGEPAWRVERAQGTSWASPVVWRQGDAQQLVVAGPDTVTAYAPASGEVLWRVEGIGGTFSASPAVAGDMLVFGNSAQQRRGPLAALRAGARGTCDLAPTAEPGTSPIAWSVERAGPGFCSPVIAAGLVFVVDGQGIVTCRDAERGEQLWSERLPDAFSVVASPWTDGERVYVLSEGGTTYVLNAARSYELVGRNTLPGIFWSTPSPAAEGLLLRSADTLYCVRAD